MKRFFLFFLSLSFLFVLAVQAAIPEAPVKIERVTVQEGETLWEIAARHSDDTIDVRNYIDEIEQLNHITSAGSLQPGQVLKLPVSKK